MYLNLFCCFLIVLLEGIRLGVDSRAASEVMEKTVLFEHETKVVLVKYHLIVNDIKRVELYMVINVMDVS